eukprot:scaffold110906_cov33-Tisochrysis_lutea.AAC.1
MRSGNGIGTSLPMCGHMVDGEVAFVTSCWFGGGGNGSGDTGGESGCSGSRGGRGAGGGELIGCTGGKGGS